MDCVTDDELLPESRAIPKNAILGRGGGISKGCARMKIAVTYLPVNNWQGCLDDSLERSRAVNNSVSRMGYHEAEVRSLEEGR